MCGIVAILQVQEQTHELRDMALKMSQKIRHRYAGQYEFQTGSDCEVILALYREKGIDFLEDLSGIFARRYSRSKILKFIWNFARLFVSLHRKRKKIRLWQQQPQEDDVPRTPSVTTGVC